MRTKIMSRLVITYSLALCALIFSVTGCGHADQQPTDREVKAKSCEEQGGAYWTFNGPQCGTVGSYCLRFDGNKIFKNEVEVEFGSCEYELFLKLKP